MASKTSKSDVAPEWPGRVIRHEDFAVRLFERRAAYEAEHGPIDDAKLRNSGKNRTDSKKALLKAIEEAGGKW